MQFQTVGYCFLFKVPNYYISLETHISLLTTSNVLAIGTDCDDCDFIVMSPEEGLGPVDDVTHNDSAT